MSIHNRQGRYWQCYKHAKKAEKPHLRSMLLELI